MRRGFCLLLTVALVSGCAGTRSFNLPDQQAYAFITRAQVRDKNDVLVKAAVPDAAETLSLTGLDLYAQGIQPVWLSVKNKGDQVQWLVHKSIDPDYFSPLEVAYMNRGPFTKAARTELDRWFWESGIGRIISPGETAEGFVYSHLSPGLKGFNVEVVSTDSAVDMTFFIALPGFRPDYMDVDFQELYRQDQLLELSDADLLQPDVYHEPCRSSSAQGVEDGLPLGLLLVGDGQTVHRALFRAGWSETSADDPTTATAREQFYRGRPPDGVFVKSRADGSEHRQLRIWAAPIRAEGVPVWWAQAVNLLDTGEPPSADPDIDSAQSYAVQSFWYGQSLKMVGSVRCAEPVSLADPLISFTQEPFFTDGMRTILWLSESPVAIDEVIPAGSYLAVDAEPQP